MSPIPGTNGTLFVGGASSRCADVYNNTITNGTQAEIWDSNGQNNQKSDVNSDGDHHERQRLVVPGRVQHGDEQRDVADAVDLQRRDHPAVETELIR